jgi:subtilisin family serine protease
MGGQRSCVVLVSLLLISSHAASADLGKLDSRARIALAQLRAGTAVAKLREERSAVTADGMLDLFIRGSVSRAALEAAGARVRTVLPGLCTAFVPAGAIEAVAALPGVRHISGSAPVELELDASIPASGIDILRGPGPAFAGLNGTGVLVGDVDSGVDYGHGDFKDASGNTRFARIWDQTTTDNPPPTAYGYGAEWSAAEINSNTCTEADYGGHGTHVMGIAGGDGSQTGGSVPEFTYAGAAPKADLVMVNTNFTTAGVVDGVAYCFGLATARSQNAVVNLSLGSHYGPHDGTSDFEAGLAALAGPGRIIVKSAGNDRGVARHAQVFAGGGPANVVMVVNGGSVIGRKVAIDGYYESTENLSVQITTPGSTVIGPVTRGSFNAAYPGQSTPNGTVYLENGTATTPAGDFQVYIEIYVSTGQNMNGNWTITFSPVSVGPANGEVDLWRYFTTSGLGANFTTGNAGDRELISEPGNTDSLITVGAYVSRQSWTCCNGTISSYTGTPAVGNLASFSSPGPTRDGREKPDITAPGVAIGSTASFDVSQICPAAGSPSTLLGDELNHTINAGTSMAAPHVTGAVALILENFGAVSPSWVKRFLFAHSTVDAFTGVVWNRDWGHGKLHLDSSTPTLLSLFTAEPVGGGVELRWQLGEPERYAGVEVVRSERTNGPWSGFAAERRDEGGVTVVLDRSAEPGRTYYYRLQATTRAGEVLSFGPLAATAGVPIAEFGLAPVAPNPTPGNARIEFWLPHQAPIRLSILDLQGREVAVLAEGPQGAGRSQATWNGTLDERLAAPGLYFVRLQTPVGSLSRRVAVTR